MTLRPSTQVTEMSRPDSCDGMVFSLGQPWRWVTEELFRSADVWLGWTTDALHVRAIMNDDEVTTKATKDNQRMWELGDVFEMFVMVEGRSDYGEFHVTPNNKRLHLHLPGVGGRVLPDGKPLSFEEMVVTPVGFSSSVSRNENGWSIAVKIPSDVLLLDHLKPGVRLRVAFARYDAGTGRKPVLSTTARHPVVSFHRPEEWTRVLLVDETMMGAVQDRAGGGRE